MDVETLRVVGKDIIDEICEYAETINSRNVFPDVVPGYLSTASPELAPENPDEWENIMDDFKKNIMQGIVHWQHNQFFAYLPSGSGFASMIGNLIANALCIIPISWMASPAAKELEVIVMDWLCRSLDLPDEFLSTSTGGGMMQSSTSECISNCILSARSYAIEKIKETNDDDTEETNILPKLIAYCSEEADASIEKITQLAFVKLKILPTNDDFALDAETLQQTITNDIAEGYIPIFLCANFGSSGSGAVDNFAEIGEICQSYDMWLHIDASYGGCALVCEEMREYSKGIAYADSFHTNPDRCCLVHSDCACLWVKDREKYCSAFMGHYPRPADVNLLHHHEFWGTSISDNFRSLKMWFTLRFQGLKGIREYQRNHIQLAKTFENMLMEDGRFEVVNKVIFGLVCFRLKDVPDEINQEFLSVLNETRIIHMTPVQLKGSYAIRFCIVAAEAKEADITAAFEQIQIYATKLLEETDNGQCTCNLPRQFAFIKRIPKDVYDQLPQPVLHNMAAPILIPIDDDEEISDDEANEEFYQI